MRDDKTPGRAYNDVKSKYAFSLNAVRTEGKRYDN